jgi:hypothetical protein
MLSESVSVYAKATELEKTDIKFFFIKSFVASLRAM